MVIGLTRFFGGRGRGRGVLMIGGDGYGMSKLLRGNAKSLELLLAAGLEGYWAQGFIQ